MLTTPNIEAAPAAGGASPQYDAQCVPDQTDLLAGWTAAVGDGVASGCTVSAAGGNMKVNIAAGWVAIHDLLYPTPAINGVVVGAASSTDRRDIVVISQPFTLGSTSYTSGGGAVTSISVVALPYAIPSGSIIAMANGDMVTTSASAAQGATTVSITSQTPTAGAGWVASSTITAAWVVAGTANPTGGAGWTRTSTVLPPVKPSVPSGAILVGEVYVEGTGATATTTIAAGNIVDKTAQVGQAGGWTPTSAAWTYVSATQFTISSDVDYSKRYTPGTKLRWSESGTVKYAHVASSSYSAGTTMVNLIGTQTYTFAANPDTGSQFWCDSGTQPHDFPNYFAYSIGLTGCSSSSTVYCIYSISGRTCSVSFATSGTSNATTKTINLPVESTVPVYVPAGYTENNGTVATAPGQIDVPASSATASLYKDCTQAAWTSSGSWACFGAFSYQI